MPPDCDEQNLLLMIQNTFDTNTSAFNNAINKLDGCPNITLPPPTGVEHNFTFGDDRNSHNHLGVGTFVYVYLTPIIVLIGVLGNAISLRVFTTRHMRKLPASQYLAAICLSDMLVLLTYVLLDWLDKGVPLYPGATRLPIITVDGVCQVFFFVSYTFRFTSAWLICVFTMERYIAVCRPLLKRIMCTRTFSRRVILATLLVACAISVYKPILSDSHEGRFCSAKHEHQFISFVLDSCFGFSITAIPFIFITSCNMIILRKLLRRGFWESAESTRMVTKETRIRCEFTIILLAISTCFVCLNIPYFVVWFQQFLSTAKIIMRKDINLDIDIGEDKSLFAFTQNEALFFTRTLFYFNYAINFFLYSLTGRQYRTTLTKLYCRRCVKRDQMTGASLNSTTHYSVNKDRPSLTTTVM